MYTQSVSPVHCFLVQISHSFALPQSWNPMWSVGTILTGLLSFMYDAQATTGSITTPKQVGLNIY